jgi:ubiquinone/menaquinone biosynthesis C-methylase UbiE
MKPAGERKPYTIPLPTRFIKFVKDKSLGNILDVGCGYGRTLLFIHENDLEVVGVDIDRVQVELALNDIRKHRIHQGIELVVNDARSLCFPDSTFDAVTMLGVLTLVLKTERLKIVNEVKRIVKPSGYIFIEEFGRTWENQVYRKRYKDDVYVTKELGTITVKDEEGRLLHFGHHFTRKELEALLKDLLLVSFQEGRFTSYYHRNRVKGYTILAQKQTG